METLILFSSIIFLQYSDRITIYSAKTILPLSIFFVIVVFMVAEGQN